MKAAKLFFILLCLAALIAPATAAGGAGTAANPYVIQTPAELQSITNNLAAYYVLGNDIDLSGVTWTPIGSSSAPFTGSLDGNKYTISNLDISTTARDGIGLFGVLTSGAEIKNLILRDCNVESNSYGWIGCLIGGIIMSSNTHETAIISNIDMVQCAVASNKYCIGVLCGLINNNAVVEISDCTLSYCNAEGVNSYGIAIICGECGNNCNVQITDCTITKSRTTTTDNIAVSVIFGWILNSNVIISGCMVDTCIIEGEKSDVGILCGSGRNGCSISIMNSATKNSIIKGPTYVSAGVGWVDSSSSFTASDYIITDSTIVATSNYAGGIAGRVASGSTGGVFTACAVTGCTILSPSYAATICPAFS